MFRKISLLLILFLISACNAISPDAPAPIRFVPAATTQATAASSLPPASPTPVKPIVQATAPANTPPATARASAPSATTIAINLVPATTIQILGATYKSYQMPGDPFRFVCPEPCTVDPKLISAQYTGFRIAHAKLIKLTGVDTLPELLPVNIHVKNDQRCGNLSQSSSLSYASKWTNGNAYICTFLFEYIKGIGGQPYSPEFAVQLDQQTIFIHEYLHTIFFGRFADGGNQHDFVTPLALFVTDKLGNPDLCAYRPQTPPGDYGGHLIYELCRQNGFRISHLATSLIEQDKLYQSGGGKINQLMKHPLTTMAQFREILNRVLGSDTTKAFADACWPPALFGNSYVLPNSCTNRTPTVAPTRIPTR